MLSGNNFNRKGKQTARNDHRHIFSVRFVRFIPSIHFLIWEMSIAIRCILLHLNAMDKHLGVDPIHFLKISGEAM
jgi:hypothetical protein